MTCKRLDKLIHNRRLSNGWLCLKMQGVEQIAISKKKKAVLRGAVYL